MGYVINNNSSTAVVTGISTESSTYGSFLPPDNGSFPLFSGDSVDGGYTVLQNLKGSPYATILLFLTSGAAKIEANIEDQLYSDFKYSSGIASIQIPEQLDNGIDVIINVEDLV